MNASNLGFAAKVLLLSGTISAVIKYALPTLLAGSAAGQNNPTLAVVVGLLVAPSVFMGGLFWLRRGGNS
ncbi:MAG: hypothetical protein DCF21_06240 [Leptolyngbya sp.]|jgi:hypothetical protein|uniref:Uncharacterized protein n=1 Tax=Shackletoniella antarctica TaxID=268115 RepID=A0A2W4YL07_9CYAN|nr:MAG: hypothetical protein DCF17_05460 [Shackletoniella antarctica]PZV19924.1 MAG: hypothetical protein DCF21_06240 [Leptolyngbya sp.]